MSERKTSAPVARRDEQLIGQIAKNAREEIRVTRGEFMGHDLVGVRIWFKADDGEMHPSREGFSFRTAILREVVAVLSAAGDQPL
jgi:hypothetical protein